MKKFILAGVLFLGSCTHKEIRIYETSYIDGCIDGMTAISQAVGLNASMIRIRAICQEAHFDQIREKEEIRLILEKTKEKNR